MKAVVVVALCAWSFNGLCAEKAPDLAVRATHINAKGLDWQTSPHYPEDLQRVMRWKMLIGGEAIPEPDVRFGVLEIAPHAIYPGHEHPSPELYYVISGRAQWTVGEQTFTADAGTAVYTPPNTLHRMVNLGDEVLRTIWFWWAPGGKRDVLESDSRLVEPVPQEPEHARFSGQ